MLPDQGADEPGRRAAPHAGRRAADPVPSAIGPCWCCAISPTAASTEVARDLGSSPGAIRIAVDACAWPSLRAVLGDSEFDLVNPGKVIDMDARPRCDRPC